MLFCPPGEVDAIWDIVAKATADNELGIAAKVAPQPQVGDVRRDRLMCVYTADFSDTANVYKVLQKLRELRLVEARGRGIYYKPGMRATVTCLEERETDASVDAFTHIGIGHGNPWGLRASIYSSLDVNK